MPEYLYAGGRMDSVRVLVGTPAEITSAGRFDSTYADSAIYCESGENIATDFVTSTAGVLSATTVVTGETLWSHFEMYPGASSGSVRSVVEFWNASSQPWLAIRTTTTSALYGLYYNSGTGASPTWTLIGSTFGLTSSTRYIVDIKLTLGSPHSVEFSLDGTLSQSGTFTQASLTSLSSVAFGYVSTGGTGSSWSQILHTRDIPTIGAKVYTRRGTADGANTGWTGAYTDVNEAITNDASVQNSASAGQKETHVMADITVPSGFEVGSVFHWMRAKNDGTAPNNIHSVVRVSGTDYATGNLANIGTSFGPIGARYDQNPGTAANWTAAGFNGIELGYESDT